MLNTTLPEGVAVDGQVRLCLEGDLHPDGSFGKEWLIVTDEKLLVFSQNGAGVKQRQELPFKEISEPKSANFIGGGAFEVLHNGECLELLRYTNSRMPQFATAAGLMEKWLKGEEAEIPEEDVQRCPKCDFPLDNGSKICPACTPKSRTMRRLIGYLKPYWAAALGLTLLSLLSLSLSLVQPFLQTPLFDTVLRPVGTPKPLEVRLHLLGVLVLIMLGTSLLNIVVGVTQGWLSAWLGNHITNDVRCQLYQHLQYLSLRFFDKRQMGTVISRVNQDTGMLQQFLVWGSQDLVRNLLMILGIGIMLFVLNWKIACFVLIPAPLVVLVARRFWRRIRFFMGRFFRRWGRVNSLLNETLNGLRVVKAFAQEAREIRRFKEQSLELATAGVQAEWMWGLLFSGVGVLVMAGMLMVQYFGGREVLVGNLTAGKFVSITTYVMMFYGPVQAMSMLMSWSSRSITAAERVFEVLDSEREKIDEKDTVPLPHIAGKVEFKNVCFGYERHRPALKNVSFTVEAGEMIGLVGHSGAGKSTTMNLLCRFYEANDGEILIDGVPMHKLRIEDLRQQIGFVPQTTFLFSGTIAENIAYAKPDATPEEIIRAAKIANAHDFIRAKPDGYETLIGEGGKGLSGGEQQRLAIARAVLHNPRILILDEATSHVDVETEKQIQEAIARLVHGRTTFAIAHRLSTLKNANRLFVLKGGEIAEMGTHDELLAKEDGEFHRLVKTYQEISNVRALER